MRAPSPRRYQHGSHIYQRGSTWYAYTPAHPKGTSLRTRDRAEAERRFAALLSGRLDASDVGRAAREVPFPEAIGSFLEAPHGYTSRTLQSLRNRVLAFGTWCKSQRITLASELTPTVMDRWVTERSKTASPHHDQS